MAGVEHGRCELAVVFLLTDEVDRLVPFYRDIVGLRLARHDPGHSAWFDTGSVRLAIHRTEALTSTLRQPSSGGGEVLLWFRPSEGVAAARRRLIGMEVEVVAPAGEDNYVYFRDPEGRLLGFHHPA